MFTLIRVIIVVSVSFCLMLKAHAEGEATLSGTVTGAAGQPIQGAEIRIQGRDASKVGKIHTDANGHYSYPGLETGTYSITLIVGGSTKASISNISTKVGEVQTLNFDFQSNAAARPFTKGKHYVWIPSVTGSHLGSWIEVSDAKPMSSGMQERRANQGNATIREMTDQHPPGNQHP